MNVHADQFIKGEVEFSDASAPAVGQRSQLVTLNGCIVSCNRANGGFLAYACFSPGDRHSKMRCAT